MQVHVKSYDGVKVCKLIVVIFVGPIQDQDNLILVELNLVDQVSEGVSSLLFLFDHPSDVVPVDAGALHHMNDIYDGLDFIGILLKDDGLVLGKILLSLETRDTLLLVLTDAVHLFPDLIFLGGESGLLSLLVKL